MKIKLSTVLLVAIVVILAGVIIFGWDINPFDDSSDNDDGEADDLPNTLVPPTNSWDSMAEVGFTYTSAGSVTTTTFFDGSPADPVVYHMEVWHGTNTDTAVVVQVGDYVVNNAPHVVVLDWTVINGGAYQQGNGALGFTITNQDNGKVWFGWIWEA